MTSTNPQQRATMAAIWDEHQPEMLSRIDVLDRAVAGLGNGPLAAGLEEEARQAAHQLAGSVGTFGFARASRSARRFEAALMPGAADPHTAATELAELACLLREELGQPAQISAADDERRAPAPVAASGIPLIVLLIDDEKRAQRLLQQGRRQGVELVARSSLTATLATVERDAAQAVVIDLATGARAALERVRAEHALLPILVTGGEDARAVAVGPTTFVAQSSSPRATVREVAIAIQARTDLGRRALLLTTDTETAAHARVALRADGFEVEPFDCADDLPRLLDEANPQLLVVDADGPDGRDALRMLQMDVRQGTPVVILDKPIVADALVQDARAALEHGRQERARTGIDPETGLRTRAPSSAAIGQLIGIADRFTLPLCLIKVSLDDGADAARTAAVLGRAFRDEDVVGRWGTNEFVVGVLGIARPLAIDRMNRALVDLPASAGVAQFPADGANLLNLYGRAGEAVATISADGGSRVVGAIARREEQHIDVAIVEDEDAISELISTVLQERGHRCWRLSNGMTAAEFLAGTTPLVQAGVILLDLNMPALDGIELLTMLRRDGVLRHTSVIVVSGRDDAETMARVAELGAEDYLVKPIDLGALAERIDQLIWRRKALPAAP